MLLKDATNKQIIAYAKTLDYEFTYEDCEEIRQTSVFPDETMEDAVNDFLSAYEA